MESICEKPAVPLLGVSDVKTIFFPGYFEMSNPVHTKMIQEIKSSFDKVHLIVGLIKDANKDSGVNFDTVTESILKIEEVDEVLILDSKPTVDFLNGLNPDFVATLYPEDFKDFGRILQLRLSEALDSSQIIKDFENDMENFLSSNENGRLTRLTSAALGISASCKKKLKNIKQAVWRGHRHNCSVLENAIEKSRKYLQETFTEWGERRERILRNWMNKCKVSAAVLVKLLKEVWENA